MKSIVFLCLILTLSTCNTKKNKLNTSTMSEYTGLLQRQGITSYQYGTHTLETKHSFYALKSEVLRLDNYIGKTITIKATEIDGYPLEGGPKYLNVINIKQ